MISSLFVWGVHKYKFVFKLCTDFVTDFVTTYIQYIVSDGFIV